MKKIVIEALYGEYSNLYGDRGNLLYVQEKLRRAGAEVELVQTHLFDTMDRTKQKKLLEAIDAINRTNGTGTVRVASQGELQNFGLRTAFLSRRFTTNLNEVITVRP